MWLRSPPAVSTWGPSLGPRPPRIMVIFQRADKQTARLLQRHRLRPPRWQTFARGLTTGLVAPREDIYSGQFDPVRLAPTCRAVVFVIALHLDGVDAPRRHRCAKVVVLSNHHRGGVHGPG